MKKAEEKGLYEVLSAGSAIDGRAPAFLYKGKTVNYADFLKNVDILAAALRQIGIKQGDVVSSGLPNMPKAAYVLYAVNKIGAVMYFQHALNAPAETVKGLLKTGARAFFALDTVAPKLAKACAEHGIRLISCCPADELGGLIRMFYRRREGLKKLPENGLDYTDYNKFIKREQANEALFSQNFGMPYYRWDTAETAVLLDSGGTSGIPKTVCLSAASINLLSANGPDILAQNAFSYRYMMSPLPIFHSYGLTMGLHAMVMHGGCNVFMPRFSRKDAIRYLKKGKINYMIGVPAVYEALLSRPEFNGAILRGVDTVFVGGDDLPEPIRLEFNKRMSEAGARARLFEGYGLSETLSVVCVNVHYAFRTGSVGKPVKGACVRAFMTPEAAGFLDGKDFKGVVPESAQIGELCVSGKILMNGYYGDDAATAATFFTDGEGTRWLKTGDLGFIDQDGFVYFLERMKHVIKVSGESVFPAEIETLALGIPGIKAAAAFAAADVKTGSRVMLAVEPEKGTEESALHRALQNALAGSLQKNAIPKEVVFYDALPRTKMMKVDIEALRKDCARKA